MTFSIDTKTKYYDKNADKIKNKVLHELMFIDSLQFMSSSLSQLVDNLKTSGIEKFKYTKQEFEENTELLMRNSMYQYSFMDDWKKFDVNVEKLKLEDFKNYLTGDDIKVNDFEYFSKASANG